MKIEPFKLERFFAKYEFNVPYLLSSSDCESFTVGELLDFEPSCRQDYEKQWMGYTESQGNPELRREISKLYRNIYANEVLVHAGAEEAIFVFMNAVLRSGDHVIVQYPCYQSLSEIARSIGCEITEWKAKESDNWELDTKVLRENIKSNTRLIVINCPNNPTGYLMSRDKLMEIVEAARGNKILLFSDEVYRLLEYNDSDRLPAACDTYENAVSLGVMSKAFGLAGLRIGWIATRNHDIYKEMALLKDYTTICSSAPGEFLSCLALRNKDEIIGRNLNIIRDNLKTLDDFFGSYRHLLGWKQPKAGPIAFPSFNIDIDVEKLCIDLAEKKGVLLLPGSCYGYGNRNFRIGFGRKNLPQCIGKLNEYMNERFVR